MIDLLSLIPLLQTAPAVSSDLSAPVGEDFSALLNELVAPAKESDLQPANPIALLDHPTAGLVESAGTKPREKESPLSPAHLLPALPPAGLFFESPIPAPDLAPGLQPLQPAVPQVKAEEDFTRAVLNDLKKFELTVHYEIAGPVQSAAKQALVTSDQIANIQQPQLFARFVETQQQPSKVAPGQQFIQNVVGGLLRDSSVFVTATKPPERLSAVEAAPTVREEEPVGAILLSPPTALAAATLPSARVFTDFNEVQLVEPVRTLSDIAPEQTEPPAAPLITTTDPIVRLALPRSSAFVIPMLQTTGDGKTQLKAPAAPLITTTDPIARLAPPRSSAFVIPMLQTTGDGKTQLKAPPPPAPTNGLMIQRTSEPAPVQAGIVPSPSFVLDSAGVDLSQSPSQDSPRSMPEDVRDVKELEVKPPVTITTLLPGEEPILETTEEAALTVVSTESDLEELPLARGILAPKALVNAKQSDPDKAGSGGPKFSDSGTSAPVTHFETRSRSVDAVEQPRQAHWVEIPHMPKLQVVRTVSMELGDAGSEVAVRIQERDGGMTLHFGTGNDSLQSTIESSVGVLVHALKQEQIQLSNVEVTRKSPIDKVRRMKEAQNGHR